MLDVLAVKSFEHQVDALGLLINVYSSHEIDAILLNDPKDWCQELMHSLSISDIRIEFGVDEENIQQFFLRGWLSKEVVVLHTPSHILEDFLSV